jgi:hypothetical protein
MTTHSDQHPANRAIVVGRLGTQINYRRGEGGKREREEVTTRTSRTTLGMQVSRFFVELETPYGEPFRMPLEVKEFTPGANLLSTLEPGASVAVEGAVRLYADYDGRFAKDDADKGRPIREMRMQVAEVRTPHEDEPAIASAVWLTGTVVEPLRRMRHPQMPSLEFAQVMVEVVINEQAPARPGYPGLKRMLVDRMEIPIFVAVDHPQAELLYRPGNAVQISGELGMMMQRQRGELVDARLSEITATYETVKADAKSEGHVNQLRRDFRRQVRQLTEQPRAMVFASFVEPVGEAAPLAIEEAAGLLRKFLGVREKRGTAAARREIIAIANGRRPVEGDSHSGVDQGQRPAAVVEATVAEVPSEPAEEVPAIRIASPMSNTQRPRRRVVEVIEEEGELQPSGVDA